MGYMLFYVCKENFILNNELYPQLSSVELLKICFGSKEEKTKSMKKIRHAPQEQRLTAWCSFLSTS